MIAPPLKLINVVACLALFFASSIQASVVDLTAPTTSVRFPEGNSLSAQHPGIALGLAQPTANLPLPFTNSMGASSFFAVVRLPQAARHTGQTFPLFGDGTIQVVAYGTQTTDQNLRGKLRFRMGNRSVMGPVWTEDAALIVAERTADSNYRVYWYSLVDGAKHLSTNTVSSLPTGAWAGDYLRIGGVGSTVPGVGATLWPGEIASVGIVDGPVEDVDWQRIALGTDPVVAVEDSGASMVWLRHLDGTSAGLQAVVAADLSSPTEVSLGTLEPGTDFVAKSATQRLSLDSVSAAGTANPGSLVSGVVVGLVPGATAADVQFEGTAKGYSGTVDIRLIEANSGAVHVDWTSLGAISGDAFSGVVAVPKCSNGWVVAQVRVGSDIVNHRDRFAVGYKFLQLGQSQTQIYLKTDGDVEMLDPTFAQSASFLSNDTLDLNGNKAVSILRLGPSAESDGLASFVNQFRAYDPATPIMIVDAAINGTGPDQLMDDDLTGRDWADLQQKLDAYGADISVVLMNWATQGWGSIGSTEETMEALIYGTGSAASGIEHSLADALQPGWLFGLSPATRYVKKLASYGGHAGVRSAQINFANDHTITVGPPVSDFEIESAGGPHQLAAGSVTLGSRLAVTAARVLGWDTSENAYFAGTAEFNEERTTITIPVVLPNGGILSSPAPQAIRSFGVDDGGINGYVTTGFSAEIVGDSVVLTKDSGSWQPSTQVVYYSDLEDRAANDAQAEADILAGALYESWPTDSLGLGMPVLGTHSNGQWIPSFSAIVHDLNETPQSTTLSVEVFGNTANYTPAVYAPDQLGTHTLNLGEGNSIRIAGNAWYMVDLGGIEVTADTVLSFDFSSTVEGEIHAIGLDTDTAISSDLTFQLYGSQTWGIQAYNDYASAASSAKHYEIPLGDHYTGNYRYLFFSMDDDANGGADGTFANVIIRNESAAVQELQIVARSEDNGLQANGGTPYYLDQEVRLGRRNTDGHTYDYVVPFTLPDLGGESLLSATLSVDVSGRSYHAPAGNVDLYGYRQTLPGPSVSVGNADYYVGASSPPDPTEFILLQDDWMTQAEYDSNGAGARTSLDVAAFINNAYQEGYAPGDSILFIFSLDQVNTADYRYYKIQTANSAVPPVLNLVTTTSDSEMPVVDSVDLIDANTIVLSFNEALSSDAALNPQNYTVDESGVLITVSSVTLSADGKTVTLYLASSVIGDFTVQLSSTVTDLAGNPVANPSVSGLNTLSPGESILQLYGRYQDNLINVSGHSGAFIGDATVRLGTNSSTTCYDYVIPFQLPDLRGGEIETATLSIRISGASYYRPTGNVDLYGARSYSIGNDVNTPDLYVDASTPPDPNLFELLQDDFFNNDDLINNGAGVRTSVDISDFINGFYEDGVQPGMYVFLILSLDEVPPQSSRYFKIDTSSSASFRPVVDLAISGRLEDGVRWGSSDRITSNGLTWVLSAPAQYGTFYTGDPWVLGPVTVIDIEHHLSDPNYTPRVGQHGSMLNPLVGHSASYQGYDDAGDDYDSTLNAGLPNGLPLSASNPLHLSAGQSLVSATSWLYHSSSDAEYGCPSFQGSRPRPVLRAASILTVLDSIPEDNSFRPPYAGADKTVRYQIDDINFSLLANLTPPSSTPSLSGMEEALAKSWIDNRANSYLSRYYHPSLNMPNYGRDMAKRMNDAALMTNLDFNQLDGQPSKDKLVSRIVQYGIDTTALADNGATWPADGGHNGGRVMPVVYAGVLLDDAHMKNIGNWAYNQATGTGVRMQEYETFFYVSQDEIDLTQSGLGEYPTGSYAWPSTHPGVQSGGQWYPDGRNVWNSGNGTVVNEYTPYAVGDLGMPEWGIRHAFEPWHDNAHYEAYYRHNNGVSNAGSALVMNIMGARSYWNLEAYFDYMDRYMIWSNNGILQGDDMSDFTQDMWILYRNNYSPVWSGDPNPSN